MRLNFHFLFAFLTVLSSLTLGFLDRRSILSGRTNLLGRDWSLASVGHGTLLPRASITDLEAASLGFIKLMQTIENGKYKERKVLVIGGQAIQHYYPSFRETDAIQKGEPPVKSMKEAIARFSDGKFSIGLGGSFFKLDNGNEINIDAVDSDLSPYIPSGFQPASTINTAADLPYISKTDLLVSKLISCNERTAEDKAEKDAKDALQIVINDMKGVGISLTQAQKDAVNKNQCMPRVLEVTCTKQEWWDKTLGLKT
ncbi:MAG: hypothetical protein Q9219_003560 [cf. Caloplaca sp. 3 TL-2023]